MHFRILGFTLIQLLEIYLILSFLLTVFSVLRMYVISSFACNKKKGLNRIEQLRAQGRFRQYPVYTMAEIAEKKKRGEEIRNEKGEGLGEERRRRKRG